MTLLLTPPLARRLTTLAVVAALSSTVLSAQAADTPRVPPTKQLHEQANTQSQALMALHKRWQNAKGPSRQTLQAQLLRQADMRRDLLRQLVKQQPGVALQLAIPDAKQLGMPVDVVEKLEQRLNLSGQLEVFYEDQEDGKHRLRHVLATPFGERFELHFTDTPPRLKHGHAVELEGLLVTAADDSTSDGDIALNSDALVLAADGGVTGGSNGGTAADSSATFGAQSTLVINVNFSDNTSQPWTPEQARSTVFDQASSFLHENSFGQTWLEGDTTPWLTLPINSSGCDTSAITSAAHDAATAAGYDLSQYNRLIFAMPYTAGCGFSGVGSVGGTTSTMLINGSMYWFTVAHEMGHNLGLYHSHALECGSDVTGSNCSSDEYGDGVDIMGRVNGHFTAFQKERLGWLDSRHIQTVTGSGIHELEPYATQPGSAPKALKIAKGTDPVSGENSWYYVEYRQASGYDNILASNANVQNGVVVHTGISNKGNSSYLLDMTPASTPSNYTDTRDPALEVGQQFTDADAGITLATEWVDGTRARVNVQLPDAVNSCTRANPSLSVTPGESVWAAAGSSQAYTLTLTNQDSAACSSSNYTLNTGVPSGWSSVLASTALTLAPGESRSTSWTVTSADSAVDGFYTLTAQATSGSQSASSSLTYVVDNPVVNNRPDAVSDTARTDFETAVTVAVLANDSDPDGDRLSVTAANAVNGRAVINADQSITYTPAAGFSGLASFSYSISDGKGGTDSASISIDVAASPEPTPEPNEAPIAGNDTAVTAFETSVSIAVLANDRDPEGEQLTLSAVNATRGTARINADGTLIYTPATGFSGQTSLSYTVRDPQGATATASVTITVEAEVQPEPEPSVNEAPIANADSATLATKQSIKIPVLANDRDPEGSTLRITGFTQGGKGSVRQNADGTLTYTPGKPFKQDDRFSYTISDGEKTATATVQVSLAADAGGSSGGSNNGKGNNK
ncbi:MAG: tandem-95 repeat protein [Oceanospirillales bacterium]|nr:tandem-95 repeat protein [Oceanospirillales bacterium]